MAGVYRSTQHHGQHVQECKVSWPACTRAHSSMASMYKSVQYHGQKVQEHTASWLTCTRVYTIVASTYRSIQYFGKQIHEYTVLWQAHTRKHSITASMYKSADHPCQHVQQHTASWPARIRAHGITVSMYKNTQCHDQHIQDCTAAEKHFCFQFMCASFDTTSGHFWMPHISQLWLSKHHLPQSATSTAFRTTIIYTQTSTDMVKLTDVAPHSAMHAQLLNCLYHVTVLLDFNSANYKGNNLKKITSQSSHCGICIS
jgi:hypothetical protein